MEFRPPLQTIWFKAKKYKLLALASFLFWPLLWLFWETSKERIFSSINKELDQRCGPMIAHIIKVTFEWVLDNPLSVYVFLAASYCLIVIIEAQLASSKIKRIKYIVKELRSELNSIAAHEYPDYHYSEIGDAITKLNEWKDKAKRILSLLFGKAELDNFMLKIASIESKDEYHDWRYGRINAFYNEAEIYIRYLDDLLDSIKKHPELWS